MTTIRKSVYEIECGSVEDLSIPVQELVSYVQDKVLAVYPGSWSSHIEAYIGEDKYGEMNKINLKTEYINIGFENRETPYPWPNLSVCIASANLAIELWDGVIKSFEVEVHED